MKNGAGKAKKAQRKLNKVGLRPHKVMVARVPVEGDSKRIHSRLMVNTKAERLVNGDSVTGNRLSRKYVVQA